MADFKNDFLMIGAMCLGSTCRSPQIFGTTRQMLKRRSIPAKVRSFGCIEQLLVPFDERPAHLKQAQPHSITIMRERSIDITDHRPEHISNVGIEKYDLVLVADPVAYAKLVNDFGFPKEKAILLNEPDGIFNPFDATQKDLLKQNLDLYRQTAAQLDKLMPTVIEQYIIPLAKARGLIS